MPVDNHNQTIMNGRAARRRATMAVALLCLIFGAVLWLRLARPGKRADATAAGATRRGPQSITVEEARAYTQQLVDERMSDPAYRAKLDDIVRRRRALAVEIDALQGEIDAWQAALAQTDGEFATHWQQLAALRQADTNDNSELGMAIQAHQDALRGIMVRDPQGQQLQTRMDQMQARRAALQAEAHDTVRARLQQQQRSGGAGQAGEVPAP